MTKQRIESTQAPKPSGTYSQAVPDGWNLWVAIAVFTSGK